MDKNAVELRAAIMRVGTDSDRQIREAITTAGMVDSLPLIDDILRITRVKLSEQKAKIAALAYADRSMVEGFFQREMQLLEEERAKQQERRQQAPAVS